MNEIIPLRIHLKHPVSGLSHLTAAVASVFGFIWLIALAIKYGTIWHVVSFALFGSTLVLVFLASALYHLITASPKTTRVLRKIDHIAIYLFIAGCYTPVCLLPLRETLGVKLAIGVWSFAILGAVKKVFFIDIPRWISVGIYIAMGLLSLFALPEMLRLLPASNFNLILLEGGLYVIGALVYLFRWPDPFPKAFGFHEIWHFFVIAGSVCHFILVVQLL